MLNLTQCEHVTDKGVMKIVENLSKLQKINLYNCNNITTNCKNEVENILKVNRQDFTSNVM
jgi:hypothetical protein